MYPKGVDTISLPIDLIRTVAIVLVILPIYLFQVMVLEALQKGYLGFKISLTTMDPIVEIQLITAVTLLIRLAVILPLKKIPYFERIIG